MNLHEYLYLSIILYCLYWLPRFAREKQKDDTIIACVVSFTFFILICLSHFLFSTASTKESAMFWYRTTYLSRPLMFASYNLLVFAFFNEGKRLDPFKTTLFYRNQLQFGLGLWLDASRRSRLFQ